VSRDLETATNTAGTCGESLRDEQFRAGWTVFKAQGGCIGCLTVATQGEAQAARTLGAELVTVPSRGAFARPSQRCSDKSRSLIAFSRHEAIGCGQHERRRGE
jgi:hypothetical protein